MKEIKEYNSANLNRLKLWLTDAINQGQTKYFETLVDGIKVIHKTNSLEDFDQYVKWIDGCTQSVRILVFNTKNSHRSQVFEFRTDNYMDDISDKLYPTRKPRLSEEEINLRVQQTLEENQKKQAFAEINKQNRDLTRRLEDAETYILKLETQAKENNSESDLDLSGLISKAALFVGNNPDLKDKLGGFFASNQQKSNPVSEPDNESTVTFRKVPLRESNELDKIALEKDALSLVQIHVSGLDEEQSRQLCALTHFLSQNPEYIAIVHGLMQSEEAKLKDQ